MWDEDDETPICCGCIGEAFLRAAIERTGPRGQCDYCGTEAPTISLSELADEIEGAFDRHFVRTSPDPTDFESALIRDKEIAYEWNRDGEPVLWAIVGAANISEEIAQDVLDILAERQAVAASDYVGEEEEFDPESHYEEKRADDFEFQMEFDHVETSLKQRTRYFNREAELLFRRLFADLDAYASHDDTPVIVAAGPGEALKSFYRARAFHDEPDLVEALARPDRRLGAPPTRAAKAGRMNAQGISVFYGATLEEAALAEVRPPVGSRVLVGRFDIVRPLRLLDIEALRSVFIDGSYFDPDYLARLELAAFLGRLSERMTIPVMPGDEPTEYLITQMIADYVAQCGEPPIDGMLYRSVQAAGDPKNVVLFNRAARTAEWDILQDAEIDPRTYEMDDDGGSVSYTVVERVPERRDTEEVAVEPANSFEAWDTGPIPAPHRMMLDDREPALALDRDSLNVHHVASVQVTTESYGVARYRYEDRPPKFTRKPDVDLPPF